MDTTTEVLDLNDASMQDAESTNNSDTENTTEIRGIASDIATPPDSEREMPDADNDSEGEHEMIVEEVTAALHRGDSDAESGDEVIQGEVEEVDTSEEEKIENEKSNRFIEISSSEEGDPEEKEPKKARNTTKPDTEEEDTSDPEYPADNSPIRPRRPIRSSAPNVFLSPNRASRPTHTSDQKTTATPIKNTNLPTAWELAEARRAEQHEKNLEWQEMAPNGVYRYIDHMGRQREQRASEVGKSLEYKCANVQVDMTWVDEDGERLSDEAMRKYPHHGERLRRGYRQVMAPACGMYFKRQLKDERMRCPGCGCKVIEKVRTNKMVQFEAR